MVEAKDWLFLFPLISTALMVISLFLPIMHIIIELPLPLTIEGDVFPFGGGLMNELETYKALYPLAEDVLTTIQNIFMGVGIGFTVFYGLDILLGLIKAIRVKTGSRKLKKARKRWLSGGIIRIIGEVVVIVIMVFVIPRIFGYWGFIFGFTMGLGMIMTIIAGGVLIFAYILAKTVKPPPFVPTKPQAKLPVHAKFCPHCGQKLPPQAIFCIMCGKKIQKDQEIQSRSEGWKEKIIPKISDLIVEKKRLIPDTKEEKTIAQIPPIKDDGVQPKTSISDRRKEKIIPEIPDLKVEKIQVVPTDIKVDVLERLKEIPPLCKFCGMDLNKKASFCPQCGTKVKKK